MCFTSVEVCDVREQGEDVFLGGGVHGERQDLEEEECILCLERVSSNREQGDGLNYCAGAPRILLMSDDNFGELLPGAPGVTYALHVERQCMGPKCGLIPFAGPTDPVTTTGLAWNLNAQSLSFSHLISTSNTLAADCVTVQTTSPIVFTTEVVLMQRP